MLFSKKGDAFLFFFFFFWGGGRYTTAILVLNFLEEKDCKQSLTQFMPLSLSDTR